MDSTDWANRFVPLPPTEFPRETSGLGLNEGFAAGGGHVSESSTSQPNLPCLEAIAGVDPFFTPTESLPQTPSEPVSEIAKTSALMSAPQLSASHENDIPATVASNLEQTSGNSGLQCPSVEVIGQQAEPTSTTLEKNLAAETPLCEKKPETNLMNNPNQAKPIVEIHEYDLAMKVLPKTDAPVAADSTNSQGEVVINDSGDRELPSNQEHHNEGASSDIASYWSQNNVSCFVPGVTPIEAYPVCREYEEQISSASDLRFVVANNVEPEQVIQPEQVVQPEAQTEIVSDSTCEIAPTEEPAVAVEASNADGELLPEPMQVDPFENEEFESVYQVVHTKLANQNLQTAPLPSAVASDNVEPVQGNIPAESNTSNDAVDSTSHEVDAAETVGTDIEAPAESMDGEASALPMEAQVESAAEVPSLAPAFPVEPQAEAAAEVPESDATPLDVTQTIPQLPNSDAMSTPISSHQLFDSVEKSLSDLQSINQLEQQETFSPVVNTLDELPAQSQPATDMPVAGPEFGAEPAPAGESANVNDPVSESLLSVADSPSWLPEPQEQSAITEPPAVENPSAIQASTDQVAAALASIAQTTQQTTSAYELVDHTMQLPTSTDAFSAPPVATENTASMPADVEQSSAEAPATSPVELQAQVEPPVTSLASVPAQQAPAFEPVDLTTQLPAVPATNAFSAPETSVAPSAPAEIAEQSPIEAAPTTGAAELQAQVESPVPSSEPTPPETPIASAPEPERQMIEVDGSDGYDFLDLKAFDVANAIFTPGIILLDDGTNKFQIAHRNLKYAVFANDFQVELN